MKDRIKIFSIVLILVICFSKTLDAQVISGEDLKNFGITRLTDIFFVTPQLSATSLDGCKWKFSFNDLNIFDDQNWEVFLDGANFKLQGIEYNDLNMLPVNINEIDTVKIVSFPVIRNGEFITSGAIEIKTKQIEDGLFTSAGFTAGNETGDPGPLRFSGYESANVDQIGPDYYLMIKYRKKGISGGISMNEHIHPSTDPYILDRHEKMPWEFVHKRMTSGRIFFNIKNGSGYHNLTAGMSITGFAPISNLNASDLIFISPAGFEAPLHKHFYYASLIGKFNLGENNSLRYSVEFNDLNIREHEKYETELNDWKNRILNIFTEYGNENLKAGIKYKLDQFLPQLPGNDIIFNKWIIFAELNRDIYTVPARLGISSSWLNQKPLFDFSINLGLFNEPGQSLIFSFAHTENYFSEIRPFWFRTLEGYDLLETFNVPFLGSIPELKERKISASLLWNKKLDEYHRMNFEIHYHSFIDVPLNKTDYIISETAPWFLANNFISSNHSGQVLGGIITWEHTPRDNFNQIISLKISEDIAGDSLFSAQCSRMPSMRLMSRTLITPFQNFNISMTYNYMTSARWHEFDDIYLDTGRTYNSQTGPTSLLDIAINKWFWKKQIRLNFTFRNVFDQKLFYHPLGGPINMSFYLHLEFSPRF